MYIVCLACERRQEGMWDKRTHKLPPAKLVTGFVRDKLHPYTSPSAPSCLHNLWPSGNMGKSRDLSKEDISSISRIVSVSDRTVQ